MPPICPLPSEAFHEQRRRWPASGRHILAHYDDATIVVYQAYRPSVAEHAVAHGKLGGHAFSYGRMSWIKPNFVWMMYRCGWATKPDQERVLALRICRPFFDGLLERAVPSSFDPARYADRSEWTDAVARSDVRLQWDPDHDPDGAPVTRRAVQLGLRGETLAAFGKRELVEVIDLTAFVASQRDRAARGAAQLLMPVERVYRPVSEAGARNVWIDMLPSP